MNGQVRLRDAALSMVAVIGGYFLVGYGLKFTLGHAAIGGYAISWSVWASLILTLGVMGYVCKRHGSLDRLGLSRPRSILKGGLTGLVGGALILAGVAVPVSLLSAAGVITPPEGASSLLVEGPNARLSLVLSLAVMWINAAFGEELLFRGFLMNSLMRALGDTRRAGVVASLVVALAFGAMHMTSQGLYGLVVTGIVGFLMGVLFLFGKRNLMPVVIAHGLINTVSMVAASAG